MNRYGLSVIDARRAQLVRWTSARQLPMLTLNIGPTVGVDANGNFILRASVRSAPPAPSANGEPAKPTVGIGSDSGLVVRANFTTRTVKPVGRIYLQPEGTISMNTGQDGRMVARTVVNVLPFAMRSSDIEYIPAEKLPSRIPAFRGGRAISVDPNDNLWIQTTAKDPSLQSGVMYDVIDRSGTLVKRVRVPAGRTVAGFGGNGVVYLAFQDDAGWGVERTVVR